MPIRNADVPTRRIAAARPATAQRPAITRPARTKARALRPVVSADAAALSAELAWLSSRFGSLQDANGAAVRLLGLRSQGDTPAAIGADLRDVQTLLAAVAPGQRCVALSLSLVAQLKPAALVALDTRIAQHAAAGIYTLLRIEARLWLHGHHLRLARRYAQEPAVLFALLGRSPLASRLSAAAQALRAAHPRAVAWLPLESADAALLSGATEGLGLLWDAARPQGPHSAVLQGTLHQPVLLDGWLPAVMHPMAHDRLMSLCRQVGVGWLARSAGPWLGDDRGVPVLSRAARVLQRAVHLSSFGTAP